MARFRDPNAPAGRVVFGGEAFIDGVTADIDPGPETLLLFKSAGITEVQPSWEAFISGNPSKAALQDAAAALGLSVDGTKPEIQARIVEHRAAEADKTEE